MTAYQGGVLALIQHVVVIFTMPQRSYYKFIATQGKDIDFDLQRVFTDADLYDPACLSKITETINTIDEFISKHSIQIPEKTDLVLDLNEEDGKCFAVYYFANHGSRVVFFLHESSAHCLPRRSKIKGASSGIHPRMFSPA